MAVEAVGVRGPAAGGAAPVIELCGLSWAQSDLGAQDGEGGESEKQREEGRAEPPPHLVGHVGVGMRRHGDHGYGDFPQPTLRGHLGRSHRRTLQR